MEPGATRWDSFPDRERLGSCHVTMSDAHSSQILKWEQGCLPRPEADELALEEPMEIRVELRPISVTMRTPGHDDELTAGFLLTEGLVKGPDDILRIEPIPQRGSLVQLAGRNGAASNVVNVHLSPGVTVDFKRLTRHVFASTSCGLCGKATIEAVHQQFPPVSSTVEIDAEVLLRLPRKLSSGQERFNRTGGLHGAGIFDARGEVVVLREDVGRHNAVDKVLGYALLKGMLPLSEHILLVSGRASFEIMQKALAGEIPVVAAVSAPSQLAVQFAQESEQTLVGFLRGRRMNVYSVPERIRYPAVTAVNAEES
jgi:FdhD protein